MTLGFGDVEPPGDRVLAKASRRVSGEGQQGGLEEIESWASSGEVDVM
jgi:hypothetical protein